MEAIEDLQVKNMSRSAGGSAEATGRRVRAKPGLIKSIFDEDWAEFRRQLEYKLAWSGGFLVAAPPKNTSRTCPWCGHVAAGNHISKPRFACLPCRLEERADLVGTINVLRAGHALLAGEVGGAVMPPTTGTRSDFGTP